MEAKVEYVKQLTVICQSVDLDESGSFSFEDLSRPVATNALEHILLF